jgi:crotonobetainyl-CoA:carnitine CoA-transferase CaiB-like acyl-CoA transferase
MNAQQAAAELWRLVGLPTEALASLKLTGADPVLPSSFPVGTLGQASIGAAALAAAELWHLRTGRRQGVAVDMRHAGIEVRSERYLRINGAELPEPWDKIAGAYPCGDGGWVRLHTNFPHHRDGVLALLGCAHDRKAVQEALKPWSAVDFETAATERDLVVAALRTFDAWDRHPHGQALASLPPVVMEQIGEAQPRTLPPGDRPLSGVRVLELTRVIAGPVCGRTLAAHGADGLLITAAHLPSIDQLAIDNGRGKRAAHIDLRDAAGQATLEGLLRDADVFIQGYRPGGIAALGAGPEAAARVRPGIVYVSLSAYGHVGPWAPKRGFDSLVQTATGFNRAEAEALGSDQPQPLPAQALDHATGYLMALGAMAALHRRATVGGSWHVRVSLVGTGLWLRRLGRVEGGFACPDPTFEQVRDLLEESPSGFGTLTAVRHSAQLSETPARWERPSVPLGTHAPTWHV